jgi:hypothetical protein
MWAGRIDDLPFKPRAMHAVAGAKMEALRSFCLFGLWPKIQAAPFAGGL